ncbi:PfkB family carbohydrate kinase [Sporolactobacillus inulinus]|uniref:PfkB family carbohydrate kinase n=1 Tax=Sporolactobacillus inulinus TaxID=2078 RepID=UPI0027D99C74|nr:PfkB family carbohydrate kinase [Sporolactobacillus inulinus]
MKKSKRNRRATDRRCFWRLSKKAIEIAPTLIKPNQYEFGELTQRKITSIEDTIEVMEKSNLSKIDYIIVSLGKKGSLLFHDGSIDHVIPPKVKTVNDTGCGDAFVGGIVYALYKIFLSKIC